MLDEFALTELSIEYFGASGPKNATEWPPSVDFEDVSSNEQQAIGRLTDLIVSSP